MYSHNGSVGVSTGEMQSSAWAAQSKVIYPRRAHHESPPVFAALLCFLCPQSTVNDWQNICFTVDTLYYQLFISWLKYRLLNRSHILACVIDYAIFRQSRHAVLSLTMHQQSVILHRCRHSHTVVQSCRFVFVFSVIGLINYMYIKSPVPSVAHSACTTFWQNRCQHIIFSPVSVYDTIHTPYNVEECPE